MQQKVKSTDNISTVLDLSQNTDYLFKIRLECGGTFGSESETSEPFKTASIVSLN